MKDLTILNIANLIIKFYIAMMLVHTVIAILGGLIFYLWWMT